MENAVIWLLVVLLAVLSLFTIKSTISFDVNKYMESRRKKLQEQMRALCPHADISVDPITKEVTAQSMYVSPSGTTAYQCQRCGRIQYDLNLIKQELAFWGTHPNEYNRRLKKIEKIAKKLKLV